MSPGTAVRREASITSTPVSAPAGRRTLGSAVVTASIRPLSITTLASRTGGAPLPSISVPTRMTCMGVWLLALHRPRGEAGDVVDHEERIDDGDRHRAQQRRRHELAPVKDVAADQLGDGADRHRPHLALG